MFSGPKAIPFNTIEERNAIRHRCGLLGNAVVPQVVRLAWNTLAMQKSLYVLYKFTHRTPLALELYDGRKRIYRNYWATPTYTTWHNYRSITKRGVSLLSNQVFYYTGTHCNQNKKIAYRHYVCNPEFVEWLMGYKKNWTKK